jgi:hypothetical protein
MKIPVYFNSQTGFLEPSELGALLGETWLSVDTSLADGTTDRTSYLTAQLAAAIAAGKTLRIPSGTWVVNNWTLPSNSAVDATGATFIQSSGVNTRLILNTSLKLGTPGSVRDTNISWTGGTFVKGTGQTNVGNSNAAALDDHVTMFGFVDGLTVKNITINQSGTGGAVGTGGRYGCYIWNCTNFLFENYTANSVSQSANQSTMQFQHCASGHVRGVYGTFGDDMVALVNGNLGFDLLANGAAVMENVFVEDVLGTSPSNGVRFMPGSTGGIAPFYNVQRCSARNVRGDFGARGLSAGVYVGGDAGTYPNLQNGTAQDIEITDVTQTRANTPAIYVDGHAECHNVVVRRVNNQQDSAAITIPSTSGHAAVKVTDCQFTTAITSGSYFPIAVASTTMRSLELESCRLNAATSGTATVALVSGTGGPGWLVASNCRVTGKAYVLGNFTSTTRIAARALEQEDANGLGWFLTNSGAVITVCEWSEMPLAGTNTFTQTAGSVATKTSTLPGASGTATLVAGTVNVNTGTGMVTASSQIRLTTLSPGGTVGHCYVASRGANTFTITSTNAADTSVVLWEVISS